VKKATTTLNCCNSEVESRHRSALLYVDILCYATDFFRRSDWNVTHAFSRVKRFVDAVTKAGYALKVFLDDTKISSEAMSKWRLRRVLEIENSRKNVPHGLSAMLGEMFRRCGIEALYSSDADNDDTLAAYAHAHRASVLSGDKDMFRYTGADFPVFSDYAISPSGALLLTPHPKGLPGAFRHPKPRPLPSTLPQTRPHILFVKDGTYLRGAPSPCIRAIGRNPHATVAPLRHAAFARMGIAGPIHEEWPEWDPAAGRVVWRHVDWSGRPPGRSMQPTLALSSPDASAAALFPLECGAASQARPPWVSARGWQRNADAQRKWRQHRFCVRSCVYEVCAMAGGPSLLELWLRWEASLKTRRPAAAARFSPSPPLPGPRRVSRACPGPPARPRSWSGPARPGQAGATAPHGRGVGQVPATGGRRCRERSVRWTGQPLRLQVRLAGTAPMRAEKKR
jgi:hypothetical protein